MATAVCGSAKPKTYWDSRRYQPNRWVAPPLLFSIAFASSRRDDREMSQSIRNKIQGVIREITSDQVLSEVVVDTPIGPVAAVITTRSVREMQLKVGDSVSALVKATNVSIEKGDSK
jgi:molybdopterin-binding protein